VLARLPKVLGVGDARKSMTEMLEEVSKGHPYIIKGTKNREALMIDAETFRRWQDAYMDLVGELETLKILGDKEAMDALRSVSADERGRTYTLSEVERMAGGDDLDGAGP
jgi:PHD/YefM family antitoxin component YafN of YafNO toxin-antitoxin module